VSVSAVHQELPFHETSGAERLIPGRGTLPTLPRKRPQPAWADGSARVGHSSKFHSEFSFSDFVVPTPFGLEDNWRFAVTLVADYIAILVSWAIAAHLEGLLRFEFASPSMANWHLTPLASGWPRSAAAFAVISTLLGYSEGLYFSRQQVRRQSPYLILAKTLGWSTLLQATLLRASGGSGPSLVCVTAAGLLCYGCLSGWRGCRSKLRRRASPGRKHKHQVLIVGAGRAGRQVADYLEQHPEMGRMVVGFIDDAKKREFGVLGPPEKIASIARAHFVDELVLAASPAPDLAQRIIREAQKNHLDVKIVPEFHGGMPVYSWMEDLGAVPLVTLHRETIPTASLFLKRTADVAGSSLGLIFAGPVMLAIAALIRLDTAGPVLYGASRVGRKGRRFRCYKFRTMVTNAAELKEQLRARNQREGPCFKIADDPRITRVGRWLRRYSLDELPQLWNVLKGEMSLVGPRPHPLDDFARYALEHLRRLDVTPGITGLWQIKARRNPSFETNLALDLEYIEHWSLWMDVRILFKTIAVVFQGTGA
jgi:exopolysaccharide biosynthesis polyprenyl glycosylphosphotransferase